MKKKLILGSQSPRRKELLQALGFEFSTVHIGVKESYPPILKKEEITDFLVHLKANAYGSVADDAVLLTADTIVWHEGKSLEKPKDESEAIEMLLSLSDTRHDVYSSVGFRTAEQSYSLYEQTEVCMDSISVEEAKYYVSQYPPLDKAGAYGIQDWIGMAKVKSIKGCYYNVMGLPTQAVYIQLKKLGL